MHLESRKKFIVNTFYYTVITLITLGVLYLFLSPLLPFTLAFLLAASLQGCIKRLSERFKIKKKPLSVLLILVIWTSVTIIVFYILRALYIQISDLVTALPDYADDIALMFDRTTQWINGLFGKMPDLGSTALKNITSTALISAAESLAEWLAAFAARFAAGIPGFLLSFAVMIIAGVYIAKDYDEITCTVTNLLPKKTVNSLEFIKNEIFSKTAKLLRGYLLIMAITFTELIIGLSFLKVKYALIIAFITALVDILPVLGSGTVLIPWAVISALSGNPSLSVGLAVVYVLITVIRNIVEPKIIGAKLGIHPVLTLAVMLLGLKLLGGIGVIAAPLAVIAVKALIDSKST